MMKKTDENVNCIGIYVTRCDLLVPDDDVHGRRWVVRSHGYVPTSLVTDLGKLAHSGSFQGKV